MSDETALVGCCLAVRGGGPAGIATRGYLLHGDLRSHGIAGSKPKPDRAPVNSVAVAQRVASD